MNTYLCHIFSMSCHIPPTTFENHHQHICMILHHLPAHKAFPIAFTIPANQHTHGNGSECGASAGLNCNALPFIQHHFELMNLKLQQQFTCFDARKLYSINCISHSIPSPMQSADFVVYITIISINKHIIQLNIMNCQSNALLICFNSTSHHTVEEDMSLNINSDALYLARLFQ